MQGFGQSHRVYTQTCNIDEELVQFGTGEDRLGVAQWMFSDQQIDPNEATRYERRLAASAAAASKSAGDFQGLCRMMDGAFPAEVARVIPAKLRNQPSDAALAHESGFLNKKGPEPHPVDYDWRFNAATADALGELVRGYDDVLCFGTPTVFDAIARKGRRVCLVDRNPLISRVLVRTKSARVVITDIADTQGLNGMFDAAVLDPPWYLPFYELWLASVIPFLMPGASVFLVLFRELTRPGAARQRNQLLRKLSCVGSVSFPVLEAVYSTPRFEAEVLRRVGLPDMPAWRVGDVVRVDLTDNVLTWPFPTWDPRVRRSWSRFVVGNEVVVLAVDSQDTGPIAHSPPEGRQASFELHSVSKRDPRRGRINIWTSRNRAAIVSGTERLAALLALYAEPVAPGPVSESCFSLADVAAFRRLVDDLQLGLRKLPDA